MSGNITGTLKDDISNSSNLWPLSASQGRPREVADASLSEGAPVVLLLWVSVPVTLEGDALSPNPEGEEGRWGSGAHHLPDPHLHV